MAVSERAYPERMNRVVPRRATGLSSLSNNCRDEGVFKVSLLSIKGGNNYGQYIIYENGIPQHVFSVEPSCSVLTPAAAGATGNQETSISSAWAGSVPLRPSSPCCLPDHQGSHEHIIRGTSPVTASYSRTNTVLHGHQYFFGEAFYHVVFEWPPIFGAASAITVPASIHYAGIGVAGIIIFFLTILCRPIPPGHDLHGHGYPGNGRRHFGRHLFGRLPSKEPGPKAFTAVAAQNFAVNGFNVLPAILHAFTGAGLSRRHPDHDRRRHAFSHA